MKIEKNLEKDNQIEAMKQVLRKMGYEDDQNTCNESSHIPMIFFAIFGVIYVTFGTELAEYAKYTLALLIIFGLLILFAVLFAYFMISSFDD